MKPLRNGALGRVGREDEIRIVKFLVLLIKNSYAERWIFAFLQFLHHVENNPIQVTIEKNI